MDIKDQLLEFISEQKKANLEKIRSEEEKLEKVKLIYFAKKISNIDLSDTKEDLTAVDFSGIEIENVNFSGLTLSNGNFSDCKIKDCNFSKSYLFDCDFEGATIRNSNFFKSFLNGSSFTDAKIIRSNLVEVKGLDVSEQLLLKDYAESVGGEIINSVIIGSRVEGLKKENNFYDQEKIKNAVNENYFSEQFLKELKTSLDQTTYADLILDIDKKLQDPAKIIVKEMSSNELRDERQNLLIEDANIDEDKPNGTFNLKKAENIVNIKNPSCCNIS